MRPNQLILASASPRRKFLLGEMGLVFTVKVANVEELVQKLKNEAKVI